MAAARTRRKTATPPKAPSPAKASKRARASPTAEAGGREPPSKAPTIAARARAGHADGPASRPEAARLVREARSGLGVTRELFARLTGFSVRAITGWEAGRPISGPGLRRVKEMGRLGAALAEGMRAESIARWLETPSEGLGGLKPVEVLERGEADRLWRAVLLIGSGMPT